MVTWITLLCNRYRVDLWHIVGHHIITGVLNLNVMIDIIVYEKLFLMEIICLSRLGARIYIFSIGW